MTKVLDLFDDIIARRINSNPRILDKGKALSKVRGWAEKSEIFSPVVEEEEDRWEFEGLSEVSPDGEEVNTLKLDLFPEPTIEEEALSKEERILGWQKYYEGLPPVFEEWEHESGLNERGEYGRTKLHIACSKGELETVRELLEAGADYTLRDNHGYTPYILALLEDQQAVTEELEKRGITE